VAAGTAAVYVAAVDGLVVGYYAIAMASIAQSQAPSRLGRGMPDPLPVILLARLAVDQGWQGHGNGGRLLVDALRRCVRGGREFGARAVVVDAIDDGAAAFYRPFGFRDLEGRRLWRKLSDIAGSVAS
jgi:predicted N-acetyltransferase YhbS